MGEGHVGVKGGTMDGNSEGRHNREASSAGWLAFKKKPLGRETVGLKCGCGVD